MIRTIIVAVIAVVLFVPVAQAGKKYEVVHCRSGVPTLLTAGKGATVVAIEMKGISPQSGQTSQCFGLTSIIGGKRKGKGFCKTIDPDGDFNLLEWTGSKRGEGTWKFIYGTGKWKGITGDGKYKVVKRGKVAKGTFQMCVQETGTYELAK